MEKRIEKGSIRNYFTAKVEKSPDYNSGVIEALESKVHCLTLLLSEVVESLPEDIRQVVAQRLRVQHVVYVKPGKVKKPKGQTRHWNPPLDDIVITRPDA